MLTAVFLVSGATLAFEVLLARVFSVSQWNHLSFLVISIALFGFAASGTFLSLLSSVRAGGTDPLPARWVPLSIVLFSAALLAALVCLNRVPLDYYRLPHQPAQALYLLIVYLAVAVPFFSRVGWLREPTCCFPAGPALFMGSRWPARPWAP